MKKVLAIIIFFILGFLGSIREDKINIEKTGEYLKNEEITNKLYQDTKINSFCTNKEIGIYKYKKNENISIYPKMGIAIKFIKLKKGVIIC